MRTAIVLGASSGIGKELANILLDNDYNVIATGRRQALLDELKLNHPSGLTTISFNLTDLEQTKQALDSILTEVDIIDLVVLSSGTGHVNTELDYLLEKEAIDLNVSGFTYVADWAFKRFQDQGFGQLVGISSVGGMRGSGVAPAYNASKAYQINYLEGLRQKAAKTGSAISILDVRPGLVDTDMAKGEGLFWVMPVKKVAQQIFAGIRKRKNVLYVTKRWGVIAQIMRLIPRFLYDKM